MTDQFLLLNSGFLPENHYAVANHFKKLSFLYPCVTKTIVLFEENKFIKTRGFFRSYVG